MRRRTAIGALLGIWTLLGLYTAHQLYFVNRGGDHPITWSYALAHQLSYSYFWALQTLFVFWLSRRFPLRPKRWFRTLPLHLTGSVLLTFPPRMFQQVFMAAVGLNPRLTLDWMSRFGSLGLVDYGIVFYWAILLLAHVRESSQREHQTELRASRLETELSKAQLEALRLQLNPHFLFNSLNTIAELIHENPNAADAMLTRLGELLRLCLNNTDAQEIRLSQELEFLRKYVDIEKIRFEDRLTVTFAIDSQTLNAMVPNLLLQPLVENAIKHGVSRSAAPVSVAVESAFQNGHLRLRVADSGAESGGRQPSQSGTGLANTRSRLDRLYGGDYTFVARNKENGGFEAIVVIPRKVV
jgi:hypothetical protein